MKNLIKILEQLICNHIWRDEYTTFLRKEKEHFGEIEKDFDAYNEYYANRQKCIKCEKQKYTEYKKIVIIQFEKPS